MDRLYKECIKDKGRRSTMDRPVSGTAASALKRSREELRNLSARLQSVREEERTALARELHDDLGQVLTAIKLDLAWLERRNEYIEDPVKRKEALGKFPELRELIDGAIATVQRVSSELRPVVLDLLGLWPALENESARFESRTGIACALHPGEAQTPARDERAALAIFRIVQESLTNVARHSGATVVDIAFAPSKEGYDLTIVDNGRGIAEAEADDPNAIGLIGMRERARSFGGTFSARRTGEAGGGTTIRVSIPAKVFGERS